MTKKNVSGVDFDIKEIECGFSMTVSLGNFELAKINRNIILTAKRKTESQEDFDKLIDDMVSVAGKKVMKQVIGEVRKVLKLDPDEVKGLS